MTASAKYTLTMGLEVHVQTTGPDCRSKVFSPALAESDAPPNSCVSYLDYGLPGSLPVLNMAVVRMAVKAALALECKINKTSFFDDKNYGYVDMPCGRQVTQFYQPIAVGGSIPLVAHDMPYGPHSKKIALNRIHIEQDAGKSFHYPDHTAVDYNRAGVGLLEIVTEPCITSISHLPPLLKSLRAILKAVGLSCDMERGEMRADLSISIRPSEQKELGTRVEVKNVNSLSFLQKAAQYEFQRQSRLLELGERVVQETRLFDSRSGKTEAMRSKEDAEDYLYLPDHNLSPLDLSDDFIKGCAIPPLPHQACLDLSEKYKISWAHAYIVVMSCHTKFFKEAASGVEGSEVAKWMVGDLYGLLREADKDLSSFKPEWLREVVKLLQDRKISARATKELLQMIVEKGWTEESAEQLAQKAGLLQVQDTGALLSAVRDALQAWPDEVRRYRGGEAKLLGFFMGEVLKRAKEADPGAVRKLLQEMLAISE